MASLGAKVLQVRSVELAMVYNVPTLRPLVLRRSGRTRTGTLICEEEDIWSNRSSPASPFPATRRRSRCAVSPTNRASPPAIFVPLAEATSMST